jgi:hypothetical protein
VTFGETEAIMKLSTVMRIRGVLKVVAIAMIGSQVLTAAFQFAAQQIALDTTAMEISIFSFVTCGLVSLWLQSDARRAYALAREKNCVTPVDKRNPAVVVAADCPKRWLVILHIEMNPGAVGL